jgi:hypothetical protein
MDELIAEIAVISKGCLMKPEARKRSNLENRCGTGRC